MPTLGKANPMTRSQALITPDNQLLLKIPKAPTDKVLRPKHPNNNWVDNVNDQLSQFRGIQMRDVVPQMSHEVQRYVQDHHIKSTQHIKAGSTIKSVADEIHKNKQFSTLNCAPYHKELHSRLMGSQSQSVLPGVATGATSNTLMPA
jgi:hypothetical protein